MHAGFGRREGAHVRIVDDLVGPDNADRPSGNARGDMTVIVHPIRDKGRLAAGNPVSPFAMPDPDAPVEKASLLEDPDELP